MEVIELSGYTEEEKLHISKEHLVSKCRKENGLTNRELAFDPEAIINIIRSYTREAVRDLERNISKICRKVVRRMKICSC